MDLKNPGPLDDVGADGEDDGQDTLVLQVQKPEPEFQGVRAWVKGFRVKGLGFTGFTNLRFRGFKVVGFRALEVLGFGVQD